MSETINYFPLEMLKTTVGDKLKGEADYHRWARRFKRAVESIDEHYLEVLTKDYEPRFDYKVPEVTGAKAKIIIAAHETEEGRPIEASKLSVEYKQGGGYATFLSKWCQAYDEVVNMTPEGEQLPQYVVYTTFINAISKGPECAQWVKSNKGSIEKIDIIDKVIKGGARLADLYAPYPST
ncbi:hypothetical protein N7486_007866 [Penicillium sp. IBT 16267x]|nr:hypothetical protein N7486_007866 [Penicillium sp. IBT 16267x]